MDVLLRKPVQNELLLSQKISYAPVAPRFRSGRREASVDIAALVRQLGELAVVFYAFVSAVALGLFLFDLFAEKAERPGGASEIRVEEARAGRAATLEHPA